MGTHDRMRASSPMPDAPDAATLAQWRASALQQGRTLTELLAQRWSCEPRVAARRLAQALSLRSADTADMLGWQAALELLPLARAQKRQAVLARTPEGDLLGLVVDPLDDGLVDALRETAGAPLELVVAARDDLLAWLHKLEESQRATDGLALEHSGPRADRSVEVLSLASVADAATPAVRLLNSTLYDALRAGASDIHIESTPAGLAVRLRIDGVLDPAFNAPGLDTAEQVVSRLKVLAGLDIAERRVPQDGSFTVHSGGRDIDLRLSIMPSIHGEDAVIRVLDKGTMVEQYGALTLDALGFDAQALATLRRLAQEPYGMLLVTGPTGSGKTTTLYGALSEIHDGRSKIITIEDPVEYQLPGILQIPVNERKGLTFARGLRSILRHDPDKIMVGEIRDHETAEIAVQSALTGHLVLTTVHANNVFDVLGRFSHLGVDPYTFVSALNGIWAQRLLRVVCPHCAQPVQPQAAELAALQLQPQDVAGWRFMQGAGCGDCRGTGYRGRRAIAETLRLSDTIRELIVERAPVRRIREAARAEGTRTLREAALALVREGQSTLAEVQRVTLHA